MAIINFTGLRVTPTTRRRDVETAEVVAVGDVVYFDTDTGLLRLADNTTLVRSILGGICITPGVIGSTVQIAEGGAIELVGAGLDLRYSLALSSTPGKIWLETDLVSGNYISRIGGPTSDEQVDLNFRSLAVPVP